MISAVKLSDLCGQSVRRRAAYSAVVRPVPSVVMVVISSALPSLEKSAASILSQLSLNSSTRMRSVPAQRDSVLTHAVTHEQKNRGENNGTKRICGG